MDWPSMRSFCQCPGLARQGGQPMTPKTGRPRSIGSLQVERRCRARRCGTGSTLWGLGAFECHRPPIDENFGLEDSRGSVVHLDTCGARDPGSDPPAPG